MQNGDGHANLQDPAVPDPAVTLLVLTERLASAAAIQEYREWSAAGRPGAISHAAAKRLLLGESG